MLMKGSFWLLFLSPYFAGAQIHSVNFSQDLSWQGVLQKAKIENKYIFVDCYASWCGPCKLMDKDVYPIDSIGTLMNDHFISVKVQCDSSVNDNENIRSWYSVAHDIVDKYRIRAYPTFLFLSPEGEIVHKGMGYQTPADFVGLVKAALDPNKQYYSLLKKYLAGEKNYVLEPYLADAALKLGDTAVSTAIAKEYMRNYLDNLNDQAFFTKENFDFFARNYTLLSSKDRVFGWYYHHGALVDSMMRYKGYASGCVSYFAYKEVVAPRLLRSQSTGQTPDWGSIARDIEEKFGTVYAEKNLLTAKIRWYSYAKDWKNYTKFLVENLEQDSAQIVADKGSNFFVLNNNAWQVFQHSEDKHELERAVSWSELALRFLPSPDGNYMDTKANLLYKLGKKDEALAVEAKASELSPEDKNIQENLKKMQEGKPTW